MEAPKIRQAGIVAGLAALGAVIGYLASTAFNMNTGQRLIDAGIGVAGLVGFYLWDEDTISDIGIGASLGYGLAAVL